MKKLLFATLFLTFISCTEIMDNVVQETFEPVNKGFGEKANKFYQTNFSYTCDEYCPSQCQPECNLSCTESYIKACKESR